MPRPAVPPAPASPAADGLSGRLARGAGLTGIGFALSRGLTFASYLVIAQLIVPRDAGQLAAGTVLVGMGLVFAESGMLAALIHWNEDIDEAASTATVSSVLTGLALMAIGVAAAPLIGWFFHSHTVGLVAAATSGWLFLRALQIVPDALLQRRFSFMRRVVIDPLGALAFGVAAIAGCAAGLGVWGLVMGTYALYLTQAIAGWTLVGWRPQRRLVSFATWRRLASYARHVVASEIVRRSAAQLDSILLGRFSGTAALGQYGYGLRIAIVPTDAWVSIAAYALLPAFARIAAEVERFRRAFLEALGAMCTLSVPVGLLLFTAGDQLALFIFGPNWPQSGDAIRALCALGFGQTLTSISSEAFKAAGRPQLLTRTHLVAALSSVVLLPSLLVLGVVGIGIAVSAVSVITGVYALRRAAEVIEAPPGAVLRALRGPLSAGVVALAAVWGLDALVLAAPGGRLQAGVDCAAEAVAMALVYTIALRLLAPADFARVTAALRHLRRRRAA